MDTPKTMGGAKAGGGQGPEPQVVQSVLLALRILRF